MEFRSTGKVTLAKIVGEAILLSSIQVSLGSVEMSGRVTRISDIIIAHNR